MSRWLAAVGAVLVEAAGALLVLAISCAVVVVLVAVLLSCSRTA